MPRKTTADAVFEHVFEQISTLRLLPGAKLSEADVASQLEVSRQPVRDAFNKLDNLGLLLVRPQRATEVRRFSNKGIIAARFLRETVEAEVLRRAAKLRSLEDLDLLNQNLCQQRFVVAQGSQSQFHGLDVEFHKLLCAAGETPFAFEIIANTKREIDRLCLLSMADYAHMRELIEDHAKIVNSLEKQDAEAAVQAGMTHLSRLSATLSEVQKQHPTYFED